MYSDYIRSIYRHELLTNDNQGNDDVVQVKNDGI